MAHPRTADPAIVGRAIEEIATACRGNQTRLALTLLSRLIPEFERNTDGSQADARAGTGRDRHCGSVTGDLRHHASVAIRPALSQATAQSVPSAAQTSRRCA